ncbi:hypothetical protein B0H63DRAFT_256458 [Podospora didyma]|uniref:DUF8035 domain-containing protein n=1 Tax=Podospora didyma TaxID=330526 RepID=A0AAE0KDU7_9PEZI|nr:hypothetical protein B0H63DRAFT_256458 [Podospora didyma]
MTVSDDRAPSIESLDAFARQLGQRAHDAGSDFYPLRSALHGLQMALEDLNVEDQDPESLLNQSSPANLDRRNSVYARELASLVEESDFTLKKVTTILSKYGNAAESPVDVSGVFGTRLGPSRRGLDLQDKNTKIELILKDVTSQKVKIDTFLDTLDMHNPIKTQAGALVHADDGKLAFVMSKMDAIAPRLFSNESPTGGSKVDLWYDFGAEMEKEGVSRDFINKHKEVLWTHIQELKSQGRQEKAELPLSPQALKRASPPPMIVTSESTSKPNPDFAPNHTLRVQDGHPQRLSGSAPQQSGFELAGSRSLQAHDRSPALARRDPPSASRTSSELSDSELVPKTRDPLGQELVRVTTQQILDLDRLLFLSPVLLPANFNASPGTSPTGRYLPPGAAPLLIPSATSSQNDMLLSPRSQQLVARNAPPPPYSSGLSPILSPPPPYGSSPTGSNFMDFPASAPSMTNDLVRQRGQAPSRPISHLAPDGRGRPIPLDAKWTKVSRSMISSAALANARPRLRYEARPEFVFILGQLTKKEVEDLVKDSKKIRAERELESNGRRVSQGQRTRERRPETYSERDRRLGDKKSSSSGNESDVIWDSDDERSYKRSKGERRRDTSRDDRRRDTSRDDRDSGKNQHDRGKPTHRPYFEDGDTDDDENRRLRPGLVIVSPPASENGDYTSPHSTVEPKPILKNKNPHRVRFDEHRGPTEMSPSSYPENSRRDDRGRHRDGEKVRGDRERSRSRNGDRDREREREKEREREREKAREKDRERERDRAREKDRSRDNRSSSRRHNDRDRDDDRQDRDKERPKDRSNLAAAGIGATAMTILGVFAEAAKHL